MFIVRSAPDVLTFGLHLLKEPLNVGYKIGLPTMINSSGGQI